MHDRERGTDRRKEAVLGEKTRDREMSEESEGATDLFHSCERCACNANSLHPSRFDKTEAPRREGCLQLGANAATVIPRRMRVGESF